MARTNENVAALLREYAELLAITGGDPFRARNYEKAAKAIAGHPGDVGAMSETALTTIPGVGTSIAGKVAEYQRTGTFAALEEIRTRIPPGVRDLTRVPGLGPRRALALNTELGIASVAGLREALAAGRLRDLAGFGAKSQERILRGLEVMTQDRVPLNVALTTATEIVAALEPLAGRVAYAGSLRRWRETIGDVDVLATADDEASAARITDAFRQLSGDVVVSGPAAASSCPSTGCSRTTGSSPARPRTRSTRHSAWNGCRRRCARTPGRSRRLSKHSCHGSFRTMIFVVICTRTPT